MGRSNGGQGSGLSNYLAFLLALIILLGAIYFSYQAAAAITREGQARAAAARVAEVRAEKRLRREAEREAALARAQTRLVEKNTAVLVTALETNFTRQNTRLAAEYERRMADMERYYAEGLRKFKLTTTLVVNDSLKVSAVVQDSTETAREKRRLRAKAFLWEDAYLQLHGVLLGDTMRLTYTDTLRYAYSLRQVHQKGQRPYTLLRLRPLNPQAVLPPGQTEIKVPAPPGRWARRLRQFWPFNQKN